METMLWNDVFYIIDLNNAEHFPERSNEKGHWYNLCLKPNSIRPESRHYCLNFGSDYNKILQVISNYVSTYNSINEFYEMISNLSGGGTVIGVATLRYKDDKWKLVSKTKFIKSFEKDITKSINVGKEYKIYRGKYVNAKYSRIHEEVEINGYQKEWFLSFVDTIMKFNGKTKQDLLISTQEFVDVHCLNDIFEALKQDGCKGIKQLKKIDMYRWLDILVPIVNEWNFGESEEE